MLLHAPAKVNLHLQIDGRRPDGYHDILSLVQAVSLYDRVQVRSLKRRIIRRCVCNPPIAGGENIAMRAAEVFLDSCGIDSGIEVRIRKRIPVGAGLGGGSSDAAAVLLAMNRIFSKPLASRQLQELAAGLGSDVPFFLGCSAALMSGRGEILQPLAPRKGYWIVVVYPGFSVSTAQAYRWYDQDPEPTAARWTAGQLRDSYCRQSPMTWPFFNAFQPSISSRYPKIAGIAAEMRERGAALTGISGSGSAVFSIFCKHRAARELYLRLRRRYPDCWLLVPLQSGGSAD